MKLAKNILITGTRKGIGRYLAEYYLDKGHKVFGCSREVSEISHCNYVHFSLDIANSEEVSRMVNKITKLYGEINCLINNAGIASMNHFALTPDNTLERIYKTNVFGTFYLCREVSKKMTKNKYGRIINFTTVAYPLNLDGEAVYASSKAAVESMTRIMAKELAPYRITVNAVGPTPIMTDLIRSVPKEKMDKLLEQQPIKSFAEFEDISNVVDFFISDKSSFITGQTIYLGGVN